MIYTARPVELEDWPAIQKVWEEFSQSKQARGKVDGSLPSLKNLFLLSLTNPMVKVFALFDVGSEICGSVAICQEVQQMTPSEDGLRMVLENNTFIRALFGLNGIPREEMKKLDEVMVSWGKSRAHKVISGNCRLNFPTRAAKFYGYEPMHLIMGKRI